jgi:glycosyltransferase involved in cell wall biosynthesis
MREKYRLPFDGFERRGLRLYDRFIAVSDWLADDLRARRPGAVVETIPNGVEEIAFETETSIPKHLLFVGRLDIAHKGGDLLFDILDRVAKIRGGSVPPLVIAGDGPDRGAMEKLARHSGLSHLVEFPGASGGAGEVPADGRRPRRHDAVSPRDLRHGRRREPGGGGAAGRLRRRAAPRGAGGGAGEETGARLVRPYDLDAFAREVVRLIDDPGLAERLREAGRLWAHRYDWDRIATRQEEFYLRAVGGLPNSGVPNTSNPRGGRGRVYVAPGPSDAEQSGCRGAERPATRRGRQDEMDA